MNRLICIIFLLSSFNCSIDRTIFEVSVAQNNILINFQKLESKSKLKIADEHEPGAQLLLCLTFIDKESKSTLSNQIVKFYHTSVDGNYEQADPNDESSARLNGQAMTNSIGQIFVETILPGNYGNSADHRHIHTTVFGAKPEAYDIHFKQFTGFMGTNFVEGSGQHFLADLKRTKENKLVGFLTIEVKMSSQTTQ